MSTVAVPRLSATSQVLGLTSPESLLVSSMLCCNFFSNWGTSDLTLDQNLYLLPRFGPLFSFVFWAPGFTYGREGWVQASLLWTIICNHFRGLGLDFLLFSGLFSASTGEGWVHASVLFSASITSRASSTQTSPGQTHLLRKRNTIGTCSTRLPFAGWWGSAQARGISTKSNSNKSNMHSPYFPFG